jgi:hypothetical protein
MAKYTNANIKALYANSSGGSFISNGIGAITAAIMRLFTEDIADSYLNQYDTSVWRDCGNVDLSSNAFPTTGGTGSGGAILKNNTFDVTVTGTPSGATEPIPVGAMIRALTDSPGQTLSNWRIYY